ncbi:hypothetical protein LBW59_23990 [Ralstonia solanacearum]|uniref:Uncharacterized protein n=1 Tax=Ralstonia solanacearum TaxID=305 RepID=A0AAW5ZWG3_RALSL|nr:hypothetical protein [Ralstonia solanacearum]MDB0573812.1 hypothetical protein [Ralstonia solanacearum]
MAYQIRQISTSNPGRYEGVSIDCQAWSDLRAVLLDTDRNSIYFGRGSNVLNQSGDVLFHTRDFDSALLDRRVRAEADTWGRISANAVTLREVLACRNNS